MGNFPNKLILISSRVSNPLNKMGTGIVFGHAGQQLSAYNPNFYCRSIHLLKNYKLRIYFYRFAATRS